MVVRSRRCPVYRNGSPDVQAPPLPVKHRPYASYRYGPSARFPEVDRAYISELENKRGNPTVDFLDKLAAVLDVPLHEIFSAAGAGREATEVVAGSTASAGSVTTARIQRRAT
jgi:helix-turn-helix protein